MLRLTTGFVGLRQVHGERKVVTGRFGMMNPLTAPDNEEGEQSQDDDAGCDDFAIHTKGMDTEA